MTLTNAIEAARVLLTAVYQADGNEELAENITGAMMGSLDTALNALSDKPMTEEELCIFLMNGVFKEATKEDYPTVYLAARLTIRALKSANVLYVGDK